MASYKFDIESDSETEACDTGNYNSRTVVLGGGRVSYVKQPAEQKRASPEKKIASSPEEKVFKPADRIRPVSLPIERKRTEPDKKVAEEVGGYKFAKIPWQLSKPPLDFPPPLDVPRIEVDLAPPTVAGEYTLVNSPKYTRPPPRTNQPGLGSDKKNTRFCQFVKFEVNKSEQIVASVENKCRNAGCNFAHTMDAYTPLSCTYQDACNNGGGCKFFHSNRESKFEYYMRSSLFPPAPARVPGQFAQRSVRK